MSSQLKLTDITKKFEANTVNEKVALDHLNLTVELRRQRHYEIKRLQTSLKHRMPLPESTSWNRSEPHH